jgi:hypothetical protein
MRCQPGLLFMVSNLMVYESGRCRASKNEGRLSWRLVSSRGAALSLS